jgi:hypothetical protein
MKDQPREYTDIRSVASVIENSNDVAEEFVKDYVADLEKMIYNELNNFMIDVTSIKLNRDGFEDAEFYLDIRKK